MPCDQPAKQTNLLFSVRWGSDFSVVIFRIRCLFLVLGLITMASMVEWWSRCICDGNCLAPTDV